MAEKKKIRPPYMKMLIIFLVTVLMFVIVKVVINMVKNGRDKKAAEDAGVAGMSSSQIATTLVNSLNKNATLGLGSQGNEVMFLQQFLNDAFNAGLQVDGNFGNATLTALQTYVGVSSISLNDYYVGVAAINAAILGIPATALYNSVASVLVSEKLALVLQNMSYSDFNDPWE